MAEVDDPTLCPVCRQPAGFHDPATHSARQVPANLTWKAGELPPWQQEKAGEPAHVKQDAAAVLGVLKETHEEVKKKL